MKIVVLNCITSNDRYSYITNHLNSFLGENTYEICRYSKLKINTIIGDRLHELRTTHYDMLKHQNKNIYGNVFSCMYNWLSIISNAYNEGHESILCLEDDIKFNCTKEEFDYYVNNMPKDANIVSLGVWFSTGLDNTKSLSQYNEQKEKMFIETNENFRLTGMFGVWFDRKGMEYYIEYITKHLCCSDYLFCDINNDLQKSMGIKHYIPNKSLINFCDFDSDIITTNNFENNTKCALVAVARNEEKFIKEWIDYHLQLGFNHIYICDNNDIDKPLVIDNDKVTIYDYRGIDFSKNNYARHNSIQNIIYNETLSKIDTQYGFCGICDIDEFFDFKGLTLQEFIQKYFFEKKYTCVEIPWLVYSDNGLIHSIDKPVQELYTEVCNTMPFDWLQNECSWGKSIFKLNKGITTTPHWPTPESMPLFNTYHIKHEDACVKHYRTKCLEDYLNHKVKYQHFNVSTASKGGNIILTYFSFNKITKEKLNYIENWIKENNVIITENDRKFMNNDIIIWQVYHDKSVENDLKENILPYYKSFYTKEKLEGDSINDMQKFINEFVCQYYVYKNNIKSDIVGFCQYSKYFEGDVDKIDFNKYIYGLQWYSEVKKYLMYNDKNNFLFKSLKKYIDFKYPHFSDKFNNLDWDYKSIRFEAFICKWDDFCKYMEFILGYFEYTFMPIQDIKLSNIGENINKYKIDYLINTKKEKWYSILHRRIAFFIEALVAIYFSLCGKELIYER